jgi:prevent-host-death family protein
MKDEISVSEFKATCLRIIEHVRKTGESIVVTKNGEPAVKIIRAPNIKKKGAKLFGALRSEVLDSGDVVSPLGIEDWEVLK